MSQGNGLILPPSIQKKVHGKDFATIDKAMNICGNMIAPVAITLEEMMKKVARTEDALGITDETVALEENTPQGTGYEMIDLVRAQGERIAALEQMVMGLMQGQQFGGGDI